MKNPSEHHASTTRRFSAWVHSTIAAILTLAIAILDASVPSYSSLYFLPSLYVSMMIRGRAVWIHHALVGMAVLLAPAISDPSRVTPQGLFNRTLGICMGLCFAYVIHTRRRFTSNLQLANEQLENRVAARSADLEKSIARLSQSEQRFRLLFENASDAIFWADSQTGLLTHCNLAAETLLGRKRAEIIGQSQTFLHPPEEVDRYREIFQQHAASHSKATIELEVIRKDGQRVDVAISPSVTTIGEQKIIQGIFRDVTERKRTEAERRKLEAQIQHSQKLESLGVLAGGLAHDFNNLLAVVLGYSHMALEQLPKESPVNPMLREIEVAAQHASDLTRQMLACTGKGKTTIEPLRLDLLTLELSELLRSIVGKNTTLDLDLQPATILGDVTQMRQIVMNLITNASDALADQPGVIRIRTGAKTLDVTQLQSPFVHGEILPGKYAFVEVEDNGCGMTEETLSKIFDPFFSTKFTGRGLGLAAALGIVRSHQGVMKVRSQVGEGTRFTVLIPQSDDTAAPTLSGNDPLPSNAPSPSEVILIVEDDPKICELAKTILKHAGFKVATAHDGLHGLKVFQQHREEINAILLDLTMPRVDGREFLERLRPLAPRIPVVVMSGYSPQETSTRCAGLGASVYLQKPFEPRELINRVQESLANKSN